MPERDRDVAIVGMACKFPEANDLGTFWRNLRGGRVSFSAVPRERWNHELFYHPGSRETDKAYARKVGFVDDIWKFAALHFGLAPLRVKVTDPQHRLLMHAARDAVLDAGYDAGAQRRELPRATTGVFVGASVSEHKDLATSRLRATQLLDGQFGRVPSLSPAAAAAMVEDVTPVRAFTIAGNLLNMMAATVAQQLDLGGPAFTIDAACSSALVATFEAVTYLRAGLCDAAIAAGVYLNLTPDNLIGFSRIGAISRTDACRPFDAAADGFVLGEGVGAVILKRLSDAQRDGDRVYAVIRGAGINNDGRGEGPMTPRQSGQVDVLRRAYRDGGVPPDTVGFVEAHGTATTVGDVVEVAALREYYRGDAQGKVSCTLSSVKANIGHTMSAAGMAGLIKAALVARTGRIPPQAAFEQLNPALEMGSEFRIAHGDEEWMGSGPRRVGVSSFGFGGTNCHLVLEEAPRQADAVTVAVAAAVAAPVAVAVPVADPESFPPPPPWVGGHLSRIAIPPPCDTLPFPFIISAPTADLLSTHLAELRVAITDGLAADASVADLAYTFSTRRREAVAVGFVARARDEILARLDDALTVAGSGSSAKRIAFAAAPLAGDQRGIAFLFPGQGAQAIGLCRSLYERFPRFRARLDALSAAATGLDRPLLSYLYPPPGADVERAALELTATEICQPAMAALGLALADLLADFGVRPSMTIGHSLGELAAAGAAGLLTPEAAVGFVAERGRIMRDLAQDDMGAMAAIAAERATVEPHVAAVSGVVLANLNHPTQVVASGSSDGIAALMARLGAAGIQCAKLSVSHAFHSPLVAGASAPIAALVERLELHEPSVPLVSCIEPGPYALAAARRILAAHATAPVDFVAGIEHCAAAGARVFVQVGAGSALLSMARATLARQGARPAASVSLAATENDDGTRFCEALVELAVAGIPVETAPLFAGARLATLPPPPLVTEEYRVAVRESRPPLAGAARPALPDEGRSPLSHEEIEVEAKPPSKKNGVGEPSEALVALFREQMAVLQAQTEIIRRQTEAIGGGAAATAAAPATAAATAPAAAPAPEQSMVDDEIGDLVAAVSAFPRHGIQPDKRLIADLGFDSLMMVELATKAAEAFPGLGGLPKSLFVNDPTVAQVGRYVADALAHGTPPAIAKSAVISRYAPTWTPRPQPELPAGAAPTYTGPLAIVADGRGVAAELAKLLPGALVVSQARDVPDGHGVIDLSALDAGDDLRAPLLAAFELARRAARGAFVVAHGGVSALPGFAKALAREQPHALVKSIAVDPAAPPPMLAAQVHGELTGSDAAVEVSFARGVRELVELRPAPAISEAAPPRVVAITGGARGLGAKLAVELAQRHRTRLILLGRSPPDSQLLAEIKAAGGDALFARADVTDAAALNVALAEGRRVFGPIEALVHAAGVNADAPVAKKSPADVARVFDTKVAGALALLAAAAGDPLRSLIIYGSWAGRFGNAAQTDYSAASHAVAALAPWLAARRPGLRVVTLDLPPWDDSAMVRAMPEPVRAALRAGGVTFLSDADGLAAVLRELCSSGPSGEILIGADVPARQPRDAISLILSSTSWLADHQVAGKPVLPLAAAADLALAAAVRALGAPARLTRFEVVGGVRLESAEIGLEVRVDGAEVELWSMAGDRGRLAYRGQARLADGALPELPVPAAGDPPTLALAEFYAKHTFHGPRLQGITAVEQVGPAHVSGRVRAAGLPHHSIDPLLLDSCLQLAAYWAVVRHGRAGLPLGFDELRLIAPPPAGGEVRCLLTLQQARGDLYTGEIDIRDLSGRLLIQLRGVRAELAERPQMVIEELEVDPSWYRIDQFPEYLALRQRLDLAQAMGIANPYFNVHERVTNDTSVIDGREVINFSSYNYLGFSGDDDVNRAVGEAVARYGTSVSASRVASGEKPLHRELEAEIADFLGTEDSVVFVGGHCTNVGVIGHLFGAGDLILHDSLAHDSIMGGAKLSGAKRRPFPHNDFAALDRALTEIRGQFKKVLIAVEGTYSMDGDIPRLDEFIRVKRKHKAMLLVDEAHSFGVLGATGRGIGELYGVDRGDVELWMGTLSKSAASCGGYIAGSRGTVEYLKYTMPGFVYSVGISPANAAAALAAIRKLREHPELVARLRRQARTFLELCRERGIDTGMSEGSAVIPCIVGNSWDCLQLAQALGRRGINVQPILYPAVEEHLARLRFFITARHRDEQLRGTADAIAEELTRLNPAYLKHRRPPADSTTFTNISL